MASILRWHFDSFPSGFRRRSGVSRLFSVLIYARVLSSSQLVVAGQDQPKDRFFFFLNTYIIKGGGQNQLDLDQMIYFYEQKCNFLRGIFFREKFTCLPESAGFCFLQISEQLFNAEILRTPHDSVITETDTR